MASSESSLSQTIGQGSAPQVVPAPITNLNPIQQAAYDAAQNAQNVVKGTYVPPVVAPPVSPPTPTPTQVPTLPVTSLNPIQQAANDAALNAQNVVNGVYVPPVVPPPVSPPTPSNSGVGGTPATSAIDNVIRGSVPSVIPLNPIQQAAADAAVGWAVASHTPITPLNPIQQAAYDATQNAQNVVNGVYVPPSVSLRPSSDMSYISSHPYNPNAPTIVDWRVLLQRFYPSLDLSKIKIVENDKLKTTTLVTSEGASSTGVEGAVDPYKSNKIEINPAIFYAQPVVDQVALIAHELEHIVQSKTGINKVTPLYDIKYTIGNLQGWAKNPYEKDANTKGNEVTSSLGAVFGQWQKVPAPEYEPGGIYNQGNIKPLIPPYEDINIAGNNTANVIVDFGTKPVYGNSQSIGYASYKKGGIVRGKEGKEVVIKAHAGELVIPAKMTKELRRLLDKRDSISRKPKVKQAVHKVKKNRKDKWLMVRTSNGITKRYIKGKVQD